MPGKIIGIIGGMGPEATIDFMKKILKNTPAKADEEHLHMLVDNNPQVPSRVKAIFEEGESPGPTMAEMARNLVKWGAELLVIPCNTAHFYVGEVIAAVDVPVLNIIDETIEKLKQNDIKEVALLASSAVLKTRLYNGKLEEAGIKLILPSQPYQEKIMEAIFDVKSGDIETAVQKTDYVLKHIVEKGAKAAILGCTELPIVIEHLKCEALQFFDTSEILAKAVVEKALQN